MTAMPFDTLKFARKLEGSGLPREQAASLAEAMADAMAGAELATKADIAPLATREELRAVMVELRAVEGGLRAEIAASEQRVNAKIAALELRLTIRMALMLTAFAGLLFALLRAFPPAA